MLALQELGAAPQIAIAMAIVAAIITGVVTLWREVNRRQSQRDVVSRKDLDSLKVLIQSIKPPALAPASSPERPAMDTMRATCSQHAQLTSQLESMMGDLAETRLDTSFMRKDISALKDGQDRILDHLTNGKQR